MTYEEDREFQQVVSEGLVPKLNQSRICLSMPPRNGEIDAKFAVELGAMILLDKPIITIVLPGMTISKKLEQVSDKIVHADVETPEGQQLLMEAIQDFNDQLDLDEPDSPPTLAEVREEHAVMDAAEEKEES